MILKSGALLAVHNACNANSSAFLNTLTIGTMEFPCVPAVFLTTGTAFPRVPPGNEPRCLSYSVKQIQGGPQKVSHYQMIKKSYLIVLKPVNEIRFIGQIKVSIKHYNMIRWY